MIRHGPNFETRSPSLFRAAPTSFPDLSSDLLIGERQGEDSTRIVEFNYGADYDNETSTRIIRLQFTNPLLVPITKITLRVYGVNVQGGAQYFTADDVAPGETVRWSFPVAIINANGNQTNPHADANFNTSGNTIGDRNNIIFSDTPTSGSNVFVIVTSEEIPRMDSYINLWYIGSICFCWRTVSDIL